MKFSSIYFLLTRVLLIFSAPLFYVILCIAVGAYLHSWVICVLGVALLLLLSNRPLYNWVERIMFARFLKNLPQGKLYDCAIVMGGFSQFDWDRQRIEFNDRADRLIQAVLFYKQGLVKRILITGDGSISQLHPKKSSDRVEGNPLVMLSFLEQLGVKREDVILELYARNTLENARAVSEVVTSQKIASDSLLMVTSAYHICRALASFARYDLHPDYYAVDLVKEFVQPPLYGLPDLEVPGKWQELLHQIMGTWLVKII